MNCLPVGAFLINRNFNYMSHETQSASEYLIIKNICNSRQIFLVSFMLYLGYIVFKIYLQVRIAILLYTEDKHFDSNGPGWEFFEIFGTRALESRSLLGTIQNACPVCNKILGRNEAARERHIANCCKTNEKSIRV